MLPEDPVEYTEYYDMEGNPVSKDEAEVVRVVYRNGNVIYGFRDITNKERTISEAEMQQWLESEDWIKNSPSYQEELEIHRKLAKEHAAS